MKKYIFALLSAATFMTSGCDSILERPELTKPLDETYGKTDNEYRLYVNEAYQMPSKRRIWRLTRMPLPKDWR